MAKYCPILKRNVVYLQCMDCDDKEECKKVMDDINSRIDKNERNLSD